MIQNLIIRTELASFKKTVDDEQLFCGFLIAIGFILVTGIDN